MGIWETHPKTFNPLRSRAKNGGNHKSKMITHCPHCQKALYDNVIEKPFSEADITRFFKRIEKRENGCWIFVGGKSEYGRLRMGGKLQLAHVASYKIHKGAIEAGKKVMHNCPSGDTPRCCNPDHIHTGSHAENMRDMVRKGRNNPPIGARNHMSKLDTEKVLFIRNSIASKNETVSSLSKKYKTTFQCIYQIAIGNSWRHIGGPLLFVEKAKRMSADVAVQIIKSKGLVPAIGLACKYDIDVSHVHKIWRGEAWKSLHPTPANQ